MVSTTSPAVAVGCLALSPRLACARVSPHVPTDLQKRISYRSQTACTFFKTDMSHFGMSAHFVVSWCSLWLTYSVGLYNGCEGTWRHEDTIFNNTTQYRSSFQLDPLEHLMPAWWSPMAQGPYFPERKLVPLQRRQSQQRYAWRQDTEAWGHRAGTSVKDLPKRCGIKAS